MKKTILAVTILALLSCSSENDSQENNNTERNLSPSEKIEGSWSGWGSSFFYPENYVAEDAESINQVGNPDRRNYTFNSDGTGTGFILPRIFDVATLCEDPYQTYNLFEWDLEEINDDEESHFQNKFPDQQLYYLNIRPYVERGVRCRRRWENCIDEGDSQWLPCENNRAEDVIIYFVNDDEFRHINTITVPERDLNVTYNFYRN